MRFISKAGLTAAGVFLAAAVVAQDAAAQALPMTNKGGINPKSWIYGPRNADTTGAAIWNPAKIKMKNGEAVIGATMQTNNLDTMMSDYCVKASQGNAAFTWTEMQHSGIDWGDTWRMWAWGSSANCPNRVAVPGVRVAYTDEREIQHALDGGAMVLVVPTVDTEEEAKEVVQWAYYPPMGRRSQGGTQINQVLPPWLPAGTNYRQTVNDNLVVIVMIETVEGAMNAAKIAQVPGIDAVFIASSDLGNFSGYAQGDADYEKLVDHIRSSVLAAGKRICGPMAWQTSRPGQFTCFQN
jgi:2-keto-3-deoxy-L-rhamnonate aldolase RhmA